MAKDDKIHRAFVGIGVDDDTNAAINQELKIYKALLEADNSTPQPSEFRWLAVDMRHLTLAFLGEVSEQKLQRLADCLRDNLAVMVASELRLADLCGFPKGDRPLIIAAQGGLNPDLGMLRGRVLGCCQQSDIITNEAEKFLPHITLARFGKNLHSALPCLGIRMQLPLDHVAIYLSEQSPHGSHYTVHSRISLMT